MRSHCAPLVQGDLLEHLIAEEDDDALLLGGEEESTAEPVREDGTETSVGPAVAADAEDFRGLWGPGAP